MRLPIFAWTTVGVFILAIGPVVTNVSAQEVAPAPLPAPAISEEAASPPSGDEMSEKLRLLAAEFAERRAALNQRRQALARERDLLMAIDRPAGEEDLARWRDLNSAGDRLQRDIDTLRGLIGVLTPEALQDVSLPDGSAGLALTPDPGVTRTSIEVNLRAAPKHPPFAALKADTLVVRLANDGDGGWSLVATSQGIGFVPSSQLRKEP
ncbi:MAG: hypothetical protein OXP66_08630 [Candidatus Tectomicrobia bacterium]|nr:hypothetical protein [Candidatus Tectomicrobia bacterium]